MGVTGTVGRPTQAEGYISAKTYSENPDTTEVPDFNHRDHENSWMAYIMSNLKDLLDLINVSSPVVPGIQVFKQFIDEDTTIPPNYDGITAARGIEEGITVEIADGSILNHIVDESSGALVDQVVSSTNLSIRDETAPYSFQKTDTSKTIRFTSAGNVTLNDVADQGWEVGETITFTNRSGGDVLIVAAGSTVFSTADLRVPGGGAATLLMDSANEWIVIGATSA